MSDREILLALAAALAIVQFLYRIWDKQDTKLIMDAAKKDTARIIAALEKGIVSFSSHIERGRDTHYMVKELAEGRKEAINTQRELVMLTGTLVTTQQHQVRLLEKLEEKIENQIGKP